MKYRVILILFFVHLVSVMGVAQTKDRVLDSLIEIQPNQGSPREQAERLRSVIWPYIIRIEDVGVLKFITSLDSLNQCCIAGQTGDTTYEKEVLADVQFFKGSKLTHTDPAAARPLIESAIEQFRSLGDSTKAAVGFMQLIWTLSNLGDSTSFAFVRQQAIKLLPHLTDPFIVINIQASLGVGCYDFGMYAEATSHYFDALKIIDATKTSALLNAKRDMFHNLGGVYARLGDLNNALLYIRKAIESAKETNQDTLDHYLILARILIAKNDFSAALKALKLTEDFEFVQASSIGMGQNATSQATCYRQLGQLDSALWYARKSVRLLPISMNAQNGAAALLELAQCEFALGMDSALQHADDALIALERAKYTTGMVEATALLSSIYKSRGDYARALEFSELRFVYQNQIERLQSNRQLAFGEFTRDNAAQQARREAEVKAELDRQRNIRYALFAGLGVLGLLAFLLYNRYRFKQRTAIQLEAARQRAEKSEAFKSRFLANMSHEIRTPLHGISGFTELLSDTSLTEKQRRWLGAIRQSSVRLRDVVNDILDLSKLEAGEVTLRKIPFSPQQVVRDVAESLQPRVNEKGIALELTIDPATPMAVSGDPTRLYQVLVNLAGNAVKFTETGKVTISLNPKPGDDPGKAMLHFKITDTGIGIPPERLHAVFESFQQAEDSTTAKFGGTGLGLTIARDLVRLYGSDIELKSEVGVGSEFSFVIVFPIADASELEKTIELQGGVYDQYLRILVVDDNEFNREISKEALFRHFENVEVDFAINGLEAVEKASEQDYHVVLMDMQMPEMNGMQATRRIRQMDGQRGKVPIIALTASAMPEEKQGALDAGMNRHLGKPFHPEELATVIADVLQLDVVTEMKNDAGNGVDSERTQPLGGFDLRFLNDFCQGNEEQVQYFLGKFIRQLPVEIERMESAFASGNREQIYQVAHSFRPQLDFVGLKEYSILLLEIEKGAKQNEPLTRLMEMFQQIKRLQDILKDLPIKSDLS